MKKKRTSSQGESPKEVQTDSVASSHQEEEENSHPTIRMGVPPLEKLGKEIERLDPELIPWGLITYGDPRDYEIHPLNARKEDPEFAIEGLEKSILSTGFRFPIFSDENKNIIDGGRRLIVAKKHLIRVPVIHVRYGENMEADLQRSLDSVIGNMGVPNSYQDLGKAVNYLFEMGLTSNEISEKLGVTSIIVNHWSVYEKIPRDILPEKIDPDDLILKDLEPFQRKRWKKLRKQVKYLSPREQIAAMKEYGENFNIKEPEEEKKKTDLSLSRLMLSQQKTVQYNTVIVTNVYEDFNRMIKMRAWNKILWDNIVRLMWIRGDFDITSEQYIKYGRELSGRKSK